MKKVCLSFLFMFSTLSMHAAQPAKLYAGTTKEKAMKQFNASLDRFKRCMHGNCTKTEALKAARDLGIAATVVIVGLYGLGTALEMATEAISLKIGKPASSAMYTTARSMKKPAIFVTKPLKTVQQKIYPFGPQDRVRYNNEIGVVKQVNLLGTKVTISFPYRKKDKFVTVPVAEVTLIERASKNQ